MKVVILAGGLGTRLAEETDIKPKPMVEIGGYPILWHIMKLYGFYGFNDFIILTGYKSHIIKEYFTSYTMRYSNVTIDLSTNSLQIHSSNAEPWKITILYTGQANMTGSRIHQARDYVGNECFALNDGDGLGDIDLHALLDFHKKHKGAVTMTSVLPEGRFGALHFDESGDRVSSFYEKPRGDVMSGNAMSKDTSAQQGWINAGFFIVSLVCLSISQVMNLGLEQEPLHNLAASRNLYAYKHYVGTRQCMDTLRDKHKLVELMEQRQKLLGHYGSTPPQRTSMELQRNASELTGILGAGRK